MESFIGTGVALVTPFTRDAAVDVSALRSIVNNQIENGIDYLVVLGTTAESATLTKEEKQLVIDTIVSENNKRLPLVLGIGGNNTEGIVREMQETETGAFQAILSVSPYYNKPTQEGIYQHYKAVAEATTLPIVLYNVPGRTGVNMTAETTLRLARDFENIVAIKEASGNITQMDEILKNKPEGFDLISGDDGITYPLVSLGAVGVISVLGNAFPGEFGKMTRLAMEGDYAQALTIHHQFTEMYRLLFVDGNPAGAKALLSMMGMMKNKLRLPLVPAREVTCEQLQTAWKSLKF